MARVILAEDDDSLRMIIKTVLDVGGYETRAFPNGRLALENFPIFKPDIVVSDINMPLLDGFGLLDAVRELPDGQTTPFLFLSARTEKEYVSHARVLGADDYLFKPFDPDELLTAVKARIDRRRALELFDTREAHIQTILMMANVVEARDEYTRGHVERVQTYAMELGKALNWSPEEMVILEYGAMLHDLGKVSIPELILNKPDRLSPEEFDIIKDHTKVGAKIIEGITHLHQAMPYVRSHHEKWDGTGYPDGLKGEEIPRQGRLLAIADVYDALTTNRSYHQGMPFERALDIIEKDAGTHFDPEMAQLFVKLQRAKLKEK